MCGNSRNIIAAIAVSAPEKNFELSITNGASNRYVQQRLNPSCCCKCLTITGRTGTWLLSSRNSKQYNSDPFGPKWSSSWTSWREIRSLISMLNSYSVGSAAGSRFTIWAVRPTVCIWATKELQNVLLPTPAGPKARTPTFDIIEKIK
ncbi:hypothetical protein OGATHE_004675 [Ogataea polymorpha]|uniref:Uncharacterized protein n=1 Tax=Ogataea polymorpha TaxID=460523 RepID=A0A9P8P0Z8_9ASCO|nr:hypothetical protein OGATHE_004675 [Ogataea polymorpha]